jgi:pimeloyl-ACP methyl ester carboxylesterase
MLEEQAKIETVRPGRRLFVRKVRLGNTIPQASTSLQVVCVHGTCASEQQYHSLLQSLHELLMNDSGDNSNQNLSIQCLLHDLLGCGQSPALDDSAAYSNAEITADLKALLERHVDPNLPLVIMGHSYACNLILPMLRENPVDNLVGCIFLSSAVRCKENPNPDGGHWIMRFPLPILTCLQPQLTNAFVEMAIHPDHTELRQSARDANNGNDMRVARAYHRHHVWADQWALSPVPSTDTKTALLGKVLVVHGAEDAIIPVAAGQSLANALSADFVTVERARHLIMMEQPPVVARHVFQFLRPLCQKS